MITFILIGLGFVGFLVVVAALPHVYGFFTNTLNITITVVAGTITTVLFAIYSVEEPLNLFYLVWLLTWAWNQPDIRGDETHG